MRPSFENYLARSLDLCLARTPVTPHASLPLQRAMHHAVFSGGARLRPRLCLAIAADYGAGDHPVALASAAAVEFLHAASLVHDDLPCFDDAATRRGKPSVHRAFGEAIAVLTGDALIVAAFATLGRCARRYPKRASRVISEMAHASGQLVSGQASESCPGIDLNVYHRQKTGALFEAATLAGAISAGGSRRGWRKVGERVGLAYQLADDMADAQTDLTQPNVIRLGSINDPQARLRRLLDGARAAVPHTLAVPQAVDAWFDQLTQQILAA